VEPTQPIFFGCYRLKPKDPEKKVVQQGLLSVRALADCEWRTAASLAARPGPPGDFCFQKSSSQIFLSVPLKKAVRNAREQKKGSS